MPPDNLPRPSTTDPRANLKPGGPGAKAAEAAWNMELVSNLPKPEGFFDKDRPLGTRPPDRRAGAGRAAAAAESESALVYTNSDLAFSGNHVVVGNYHGFNTYNIERANRPQLIASVVCPGGQGDVSIWGNLLFMSVEQTRGRLDCGLQGVVPPVSNERFRGVRIFDITDSEESEAGGGGADLPRLAHAHAGPRSAGQEPHLRVRLGHRPGARRVKSWSAARARTSKEDPNTSLFSIDVIEVPLAAPQNARIVNQPRIFMERRRGDARRPVAGRRSRPQHAAHAA